MLKFYKVVWYTIEGYNRLMSSMLWAIHTWAYTQVSMHTHVCTHMHTLCGI